MKRITVLVLTLFGAIIAPSFAQPSGQSTMLQFEQSNFDFGRIAESGGAVTHRYTFTNAGSSALVITKVITSCTCTKAEYSKKPVAPGAKGYIEVRYDPKKRPGAFYKAIQVFSNAPERRVIITAKGVVY